jgi:hypothetical protein
MPDAWRRTKGGIRGTWKSTVLTEVNIIRRTIQNGAANAGSFLAEQCQRPVVRGALLVAALAAAREPITLGALSAAQIVAEKSRALAQAWHGADVFPSSKRTSAGNVGVKRVLVTQRQEGGWFQWLNPLAYLNRANRKGRRIDVSALGRVQHQSLWDRLRGKIARPFGRAF